MRVIELPDTPTSLDELLNIARRETIILRQSNTVSFVLAPIDEGTLEVELLRQNKEFMAHLDDLSQQDATIPLTEVERELGL